MKPIIKLSLQHNALVKVAATLWNRNEVRNLLSLITKDRKMNQKMKDVKDIVMKTAKELTVPESLKIELSYYIDGIGGEILLWLDYHVNSHYLQSQLPDEFHWTSQGTIDKKRTALEVLKNPNIYIVDCFKLACIYCLEDQIFLLWGQLSEYHKLDLKRTSRHKPRLISFWSYYAQGKLSNLIYFMREYCNDDNATPYLYAFLCSVHSGNVVATEYFFKKLTFEEKDKILSRAVRDAALKFSKHGCNYSRPSDFVIENCSEVFYFLFFKMKEEQQKETLRLYSFEVLRCFMNWPWQNCFLDMDVKMYTWNFLTQEYFYHIVASILFKIIDNYKDFNYQKLFEKFWQEGSSACKSYILDECCRGCMLLSLLTEKHERNFELILKDATDVQRERIICSNVGNNICMTFIAANNWSRLKLFLQECVKSEQSMVKFKESFQRYLNNSGNLQKCVENHAEWKLWNQLVSELEKELS